MQVCCRKGLQAITQIFIQTHHSTSSNGRPLEVGGASRAGAPTCDIHAQFKLMHCMQVAQIASVNAF